MSSTTALTPLLGVGQLAIALAFALTASSALADGGAGGGVGGGGVRGGAAGVSNTQAPGVDGGAGQPGPVFGAGGGGGGAGTTGGDGGDGGDGAVVGSGGAGGVGGGAPGAAGAVGTVGAVDGGAGGGGGGAHGFVGAIFPGAAATGGVGGAGGAAPAAGGGGGGGAAGHGATITAGGVLGTLIVGATGGAGGVGGASAAGAAGSGGEGGTGLLFTGPGTKTFTIGAGVTGGVGGAAGAGVVAGSVGAAGAGIVGQNLLITMGAAGAVTGGVGANSITFTGGINSLTFVNPVSTLTGNIGVTGLLTFEQAASDVGVANIITGSGSIAKTGIAVVNLSGISTYSGSTTVTAGTLRASTTGALGAPAGALIVNGGILDITAAQSKGNLSGAGGAINLDAALLLNQSLDQSYAGAFTGAADLTKGGTAALTLTGNSAAYAGDTTVTGGALFVSNGAGTFGNAGTLVSVNGGATLGGTGAIGGGVAIAGSATLAPGAPGIAVGTLTVAGNLAMGAGSIYAIEVSSAASDLTNVGGTANLSGAAVAVTYVPGSFSNRRYTILTAGGGLGGTIFTGVTNNAPGIQSTLAYDANNAYLDIELALALIPGLNSNQVSVAGAIDRFLLANGTIPLAFAMLDPAGLALVSGEISTAAVSAGFYSSDLFLAQISDPFVTGAGGPDGQFGEPSAYAPLGYSGRTANLSAPGALAALGGEAVTASDAANATLAMSSAHAADPVDPVDAAFGARWKMWGAAYGGAQQIGGNTSIGSSDLTVRNWGVASGFDRTVGSGHYGLALGGSGSSFSLANGLGSGAAGVFNAGLYGAHNFGNAYVSGALAYAWNSVRTSRIVGPDTLSGSFNAHTLSARAEAGYRFDTSFAAIIPYAAVQGSSYFIPGYAETSSGATTFALAYGRQTEMFARTELGTRFEHAMPMASGAIRLTGRAAWAYNAATNRAVTAAFQALPGQSFTVNGAAPDRHSALLDLGVEAAFDNGVSAKLSFNGEFSRNVTAYGASAKISYKW